MTLGQFGTSSDTASSTSTFTALSLGGSLKATDRLSLTGNFSYTVAKENLDSLSLAMTAAASDALHWSAYDFSTWHTYVKLDSTSWDATVQAEAHLSSAMIGVLSYTYLDFNDNAHYLEDLTGNLDIVRLALRWKL